MSNESQPHILIIGEPSRLREGLGKILVAEGYDVAETDSSGDVLRSLQAQPTAVALIDTFHSGSPAPLLTHAILKASPFTEVIILMGHSSHRPSALSAVGNGAFTYLHRSPDMHQVTVSVRRAVERRQLRLDAEEMRHRLAILFETLPAGILIVDAETRVVVDANAAALQLIGEAKEAIVGQTCLLAPHGPQAGGVRSSSPAGIDAAWRIPATRTITHIDIEGRPHTIEAFVDLTGSLVLEQELRLYQTLCRLLLEQRHETVFSVDRDGNIVTVFKPGESRLLSPAPGLSATVLLPPGDQGRFIAALHSVFDEGWERELSDHLASPPSWNLRLLPVPGPSATASALVILQDLSARRRIDTRLLLRDEVVNQMESAVVVVNERGLIADANPVLCNWLGVSASDLIGRSYQSVDRCVPHTRWEEQLHALSEQAQVEYESDLYDGSGARHRSNAIMRLARIGDTRFVITVYERLTPHLYKDETIRQLQNIELEILAGTPDAALILDRQGRILRMNALAETVETRGTLRIVGTSYFESLPAEVANDRRRRIEDVLLIGHPSRFEDQVDGRTFEHTARPVPDHAGVLRHVVLLTRDVTEARDIRQRLQTEREHGPDGVWILDVAGVEHWIETVEAARRDNPMAAGATDADSIDTCLETIVVRDANLSLLALLGAAESDIVRLKPSRILTAGGRKSFTVALTDVLRGRTPEAFELALVTLSGGQTPVACRMVLTRSSKAVPIVTAWMSDLRPLREAQAEVLRMSGRERQRTGETLKNELLPILDRLRTEVSGTVSGTASATLAALIEQARGPVERLAGGLLQEDMLTGSLIAALQRLAQETTTRHGITCRCNLGTPGAQIDRMIAARVFQIAREAVDLAIRRRKAASVVIALTSGRAGHRLVVRDTGGAPADDEADDAAWILMRQHAGLIHATIETDRDTGGNTIDCTFH